MDWVWEAFGIAVWLLVAALVAAGKRSGKPEKRRKLAEKMKKYGIVLLPSQPQQDEDEAADDPFEREQPDDLKGNNPPVSASVVTLGKLFQEDCSNDWLARQRREEQKHTVWHNFSDLGAQHDALCDAKVLRAQHQQRHEENVVDDGTV